MYLISAYFDEKTTQAIEKHIGNIAAETGNTFMTDNHVPPHLTICSVEARSGERLISCMESCKERMKTGEIQLVSVGALFPYVLYMTPILNGYLQQMSMDIYSAVREIPEVLVSKYYKPMQWLPHVTLAKTLTKEQMQTAFVYMQEHFIPLEGKIVRIGLAKTNPHKDIWETKMR